MTEEAIKELENFLDKSFVENKMDIDTPREDFEKFIKKIDFNDLVNFSLEKLLWIFFCRGIAAASKYEKEVSIEELLKDIDTEQFIQDVKEWQSVRLLSPMAKSPLVDLFDGHKIIKVDLNKLVGE